MTKRMLINAQRPEEVRVAIMSGDTLDGYQVAVAEAGLARGNIYRGVVANINPGLDAAFVDFGAERDGMLPAHDVVPQAHHRKPPAGEASHRIERILERGRPILVQVTKDPAGSKGAALTTNLSLAGRYLVLMPFDATRGISRKVEDEEVRAAMREQASRLTIPEGFGLILRTNALGQTKADLSRDLAGLLRLWKRVTAEADRGKGPRLLYSDQDLVVQALRDYLDSSIEEVLVDDDHVFERAQAYMHASMPRGKTRLVRYTERMPLFSRFEVEPQIDSIYARTVLLRGGGSIVIDATEALTAIDVNSGKASHGASQEDSAYAVNLEAAREVARQLRLRDIGGLVVVDFIDMRSGKHEREVEKTVREAMKADKARATVGRISPNGLLEINRQRIKQALRLRTHRPCPTCGGTGTIPSPEFVGVNLLRRIEARAAGGHLRGARVGLHPELADAIQNFRRHEIAALEREFDMRIEIIAMTSLHRSEENVEWIQRDADEARPRLVPAAAASPGPSAEEEPQKAAEKRRRRRRGGRRHRKSAATPPGTGGATETAATPEAVPQTGAGEGTKAKKRRRRRRRAGKVGAGAAVQGG
ncbi:MAG TPA: Rne/Rng family ribonuclease [Thermoanaerobaculaceae bacterium]|nr:Rne/Rng family ribonuclease [Thermoanaerobaculaceae bacterium]